MRGFARTVAFGMAMALFVPAARAETLADTLVAAYRNSNLLEQNQATLRAADEDVAGAVSALRPVVSYTLNSGYSNRRGLVSGRVSSEQLATSLTLSADITLYNGGRNRLGIEIARESVMATRAALLQVEQQVLFDAVDAYVDILLRQEILVIRQSNLRLIQQELRAANDRFEVGEITRTDVAIAESRLAGARSSLASAEGDLLVARENYKLAVGNYPGTLRPLPPSPGIGQSLEEARNVAMRTHPSIRQGQHLVSVADLQVKSAKGAFKPTVTLGADLFASDTDVSIGRRQTEQLDSSVGLTMRQTLYGGGGLSATYRRAIASQEAQRASLNQTMLSVDRNLGVAWSGLGVSLASIEASQRQIVAAQTAFDGVREEAALGARTTLDVLDTEQDLLDARILRLQAEAQRYMAVYQILGAMGLLTVDHLKLGVPQYDPEAYYNAVKSAPATSSQGKALDRILKTIGN